jgi:hypothetical protein
MGIIPIATIVSLEYLLSGANIVGLANITGEMNITPAKIKRDMLILERPSKQRNQYSIVKKREKNVII